MADKSGVVLRKRGINYNGQHYPHKAAITLPAQQFEDWAGAKIVGEATEAQAKKAKPVSNERAPAKRTEAAEPLQTI
jgi:hypothetical protein